MVDTVFKDGDVEWANTSGVEWEKGGYSLALDSGSVGVTGTDAAFTRVLKIPLAGGTYTITGSDVALINSEGRTLALDPGVFTMVGTAAGLTYDRAESLDPGVCTITGSDLAMMLDRQATLESGIVSVVGTDINFDRARIFSLGSGEFSIAGSDLAFSIETASIAGNVVYLFTLTGAEDGEADIEIPMSSFNARLRSGDPTYLQAVFPWLTEYVNAINARPNGTMQVDLAYKQGGTYIQRENIIQANLEDIRTDEGALNKSITLIGHKQKTYINKSITMQSPTYRNSINGALRYRFAEPNMHLFPGDTVTVDTDVFPANVISYSVAARTGGISTLMEISES